MPVTKLLQGERRMPVACFAKVVNLILQMTCFWCHQSIPASRSFSSQAGSAPGQMDPMKAASCRIEMSLTDTAPCQ